MNKFLYLLKNKKFWRENWGFPAAIFAIGTTVLAFCKKLEEYGGGIFLTLIVITILYFIIKIIRYLMLSEIVLTVDGSRINIKSGNIFESPSNAYKVIAFNEYFDTQVDDELISSRSLNGQYLLKKYCSEDELVSLNERIEQNIRLKQKILNKDVERELGGKKIRYKLGSIFKDGDYFLVAFSKFDNQNEAHLKLHEYANCLIEFWNEVNTLYAEREIIVPLLGSGITRKEDFSKITNQQLLEIMIWTFKISKAKFKEPAQITIILYGEDDKDINFYKLKELEEEAF